MYFLASKFTYWYSKKDYGILDPEIVLNLHLTLKKGLPGSHLVMCSALWVGM